jgi:predicted transcriptional regulator with HTH domain
VKIKKKSGELQDFDQDKLEKSMLDAGATPQLAKQISSRVQPSEGLSSDDLRRRVSEELLRENTYLAGAYLSTRRFTVKNDPSLVSGIVRMDAEHFNGISASANAILYAETNKTEVHLQAIQGMDPGEIQMSFADMDKLHVSDGSCVAVRFPS